MAFKVQTPPRRELGRESRGASKVILSTAFDPGTEANRVQTQIVTPVLLRARLDAAETDGQAHTIVLLPVDKTRSRYVIGRCWVTDITGDVAGDSLGVQLTNPGVGSELVTNAPSINVGNGVGVDLGSVATTNTGSVLEPTWTLDAVLTLADLGDHNVTCYLYVELIPIDDA